MLIIANNKNAFHEYVQYVKVRFRLPPINTWQGVLHYLTKYADEYPRIGLYPNSY